MSVTIAERVLPHNLEAERAVLGAILLHERETFHLVAALLGPEDYFRDAHRRVFAAMVDMNSRGVVVDLVTLKDELGRHGVLDEVGGPAYIAALVDGVPRSTNVEHYARIVREKARLRGLIFAANKVAAQAYEDETAASAIVEDGVQALLALASTSDATATRADKEVLEYVMALDHVGTSPDAPMPTGFTDLDEILDGGLRAHDLIVVGGRPSSGKTSLGLAVALGAAKREYASVFFSLEMRARALAGRLVGWGAHVDQHRMKTGFLSERDYQRIAAAAGALDVPLYLQDTAATLTEVSAWCQRLKAEHDVKLAVVDYLQKLLPDRRGQSREIEVATISAGLKRLAKVHGLAVVALCALNRSPEERRDNRPRASDLRESGAIESDADVVLLLHRQEQYDKAEEHQGIAEVIVAKNRDGGTGVAKLCFIAQFGGLFENLAVTSNESTEAGRPA